MARTIRQILFLLRALSKAGIWIPLRKWRQFYLIARTRWSRNQYLPRFARGQDYNDMIAFAALFQLTEDMSKYTDKILVREYIKQCIGDQHLSEILQVTDDPYSLNFELARGNYIKTNNSSGHVWSISQNTKASLLLPEIVGALNQTYGTGKGERLYQHIAPKVFIEQTIEPRRGSELDEFKFAYHYGQLLWMYVGSSKEAEKKMWHCFDGEQNPLYSCFEEHDEMIDPTHQNMDCFIDRESLAEMISLGEKCTEPFHFCRFDSFLAKDEIIFSELTFMPQSANWIRNAPEGKLTLQRFPEFFRKDKIRPLKK